MKNRRYRIAIICIIFLPLFAVNCSPSGKKENVHIKGRFVFSRGETVYLKEILAFEKTLIDSVRLNENGEFEFSVPVKDVSIFWLGTSEDNYLTLICEKGEKAEVTGDIRSLPATYTVSGSPASGKILELHKFTLSNYIYFDSLSAIWEKRKYDSDKLLLRDSLDSMALTVYQSQKDYVLKFVNDNMQSLAAIMALYQVFGRVTVLDEFEYIELYEKTADVLRIKYPANQHVNELSARVAKNKLTLQEKEEIVKRLQPGNPVPELSLPDKDGKPVSVGELKGSTVLIYFWSATSPPSRKMNQDLIRIHRQFAPRGFTLYTVSFDNNTDNWKKALELDKLPGFHVNDQRSLSSPVFKMFNFSDLPHSILVDSEGIIIGSSLNTDEINAKLYELLPQQRNAAPVQ